MCCPLARPPLALPHLDTPSDGAARTHTRETPEHACVPSSGSSRSVCVQRVEFITHVHVYVPAPTHTCTDPPHPLHALPRPCPYTAAFMIHYFLLIVFLSFMMNVHTRVPHPRSVVHAPTHPSALSLTGRLGVRLTLPPAPFLRATGHPRPCTAETDLARRCAICLSVL